MVDQKDNITSQFFKAIYQLIGWTYDPFIFDQSSFENRMVIKTFVFDPLTKEQKQQIERRSKTHRMQIPPPLDSMIDLPYVIEQVQIVLNQILQGKTYEEMNELYRTGNPVSIDEFNQAFSKLVRNHGR